MQRKVIKVESFEEIMKIINHFLKKKQYENTNRNFIGIENNMDYFNISLKRVEEKRKEKDFTVVTSFGDGM